MPKSRRTASRSTREKSAHDDGPPGEDAFRRLGGVLSHAATSTERQPQRRRGPGRRRRRTLGAAEEGVSSLRALRQSRWRSAGSFGTFYGCCTGYPECKNIRKTGPNLGADPDGRPLPRVRQGEIVEKKSHRGKDHLVVRPLSRLQVSLGRRPVSRDCPQCTAKVPVEERSPRSTAPSTSAHTRLQAT